MGLKVCHFRFIRWRLMCVFPFLDLIICVKGLWQVYCFFIYSSPLHVLTPTVWMKAAYRRQPSSVLCSVGLLLVYFSVCRFFCLLKSFLFYFHIFVLKVGLFTLCLACYRTRLRQRKDKMLTTAHEAHPSLAPISTRRPSSPKTCASYGLGFPSHPSSTSFYNIHSQPYPTASNSIYPSLSGYVHQNPMTVSSHSVQHQPDYPIEPRIERQNAVFAAGRTCIPFFPSLLDI